MNLTIQSNIELVDLVRFKEPKARKIALNP
jgi:hypothetical protein